MAKQSLKTKLTQLAESFNWEYTGCHGTYHNFKKRGAKYLMELMISKSGHGFCSLTYSFKDEKDILQRYKLGLREVSSLCRLHIKIDPMDVSVESILGNVGPGQVYDYLIGRKLQSIEWHKSMIEVDEKKLKKLKKCKPYFE